LKALEYEFSERLCNTQIRYFIGLHYLNERAYTEALLVLQRVASDVEATIEFAQKSNLHTQRNIKRDISELLEEVTLKSLNGLLCKTHAKVLLQQHEEAKKERSEMMEIDGGAGSQANKNEVKFDNLYDILFDGAGRPKSDESLGMKVVISGDRLDFLEQQPVNIQFVEPLGGKKAVEIEKLKISKQFKLVNPVPKFQSVPATPHVFDLAGDQLSYPSLEEPIGKYKTAGAGGLFKKLTGFFGR